MISAFALTSFLFMKHYICFHLHQSPRKLNSNPSMLKTNMVYLDLLCLSMAVLEHDGDYGHCCGLIQMLLQRNYKMVDIREVEVARTVTLIQQEWTYRQIASDIH
ncbi:hypothetical protein ANN_01077 [Periplaneta americana]|uniref:Uncharacterized protein n=1 Tax=Periplaneta americana TaxID=6978 RepID=A0ABQ8TV24_PERAM|nr:hypothetical protein ANN_01077 [Periplaneta americana]